MPTFHWPEYLIEGALLGIFMLSACVSTTLFEHPASVLHDRIPSSHVRRTIIGVLMGLTAVALIYSPFGQRSGAHMNPATTLTFFLLGKVNGVDAFFYVLAQFAGGLVGVLLSSVLLRGASAHPVINHAPTVPGLRSRPRFWAFLAELTISFGMMLMVLLCSNNATLAPYTGIFAGALVALYIAVEAPISGMSINPARTLASAIPARTYRGLWIYFFAPSLGMFLAAFAFAHSTAHHIYCAKLDHDGDQPCIFHCEIDTMPGRRASRVH